MRTAAFLLLLVSSVVRADDTSYSVLLTDAGAQKIQIIKIVRDFTGLGLKDAKDLVEAPKPRLVREGLTHTDADALVSALTANGATAEVHQGGQKVPGPPMAAAPTETTFDVRLERVGTNKIAVIKLVRDQTGLGLGDTNTLVSAAPVIVVKGLRRPVADAVIRDLLAAGAKATLVARPPHGGTPAP